MQTRALSIFLMMSLSIGIAMLNVGPYAAPRSPQGRTSIRTAVKPPSAKPTPKRPAVAQIKYAKYEPPRGVYLGAALDFSGVSGEGSKTGKIADVMGAWEAQAWKEHAIYVQFLPFPHEDGSF